MRLSLGPDGLFSSRFAEPSTDPCRGSILIPKPRMYVE